MSSGVTPYPDFKWGSSMDNFIWLKDPIQGHVTEAPCEAHDMCTR